MTDELSVRSRSRSVISATGSSARQHQSVLDDFTERLARGEIAGVEAYLAHLGQVAPSLQVELIYREYCLAERKGVPPDPAVFLARFPAHREMLERLFSVHRACPSSQLDYLIAPTADADILPQAGDEIGPYLLRRELGRGAFARVFLAEQCDLENRLVILKLSTRPTREPWLLARARHSHIVEILSHAVVDDGAFQLICMPFLGGATLSAVLDHRRQVPRSRGSRGDLLRDLDAVAAAEYSGVNPARPAREILNRLTDCQAMAWITARLADALDHAQCRDVIHGDVKPSNILLTADGNPMLLDFNLARNWLFDKTNGPLEETGGTLAYMAPERLRSLPCVGLASLDDRRSCEPKPAEGDDPHSSDIYSLGIVLLEALTSAVPAEVMHDPVAPTPGPRNMGNLAAAYASFRERGAVAVIRASETAGGQAIPPTLRAILERCLAVRPAERYRRALELAEDLDRWRADLPLAYAVEPFWAQTLPRTARRHKKLLFAAGLTLVMCLIATYLAANRIQTYLTLGNMAKHKLARLWDDIESRAFQFQRPGSPRLQNPDARETWETAKHALSEYQVLGDADWRQREDVRNLPEQDRNDLGLWLMEQTLRYCRALSNRADSPGDWSRAVAALDRMDTTPPLQAFEILRRRLNARLGQGGSRDSQVPERVALPPDPPWLPDYLLGVVTELENDDDLDVAAKSKSPAATPDTGKADASSESGDATLPAALRTASQQALRHYDRVLARCPDSFWGHYRAAVVCFQLQQWSEAAGHLDRCLQRRSENAALRGQYASCLGKLGLPDAALRECSRALESAPDYAEFYRSRAFLRVDRDRVQTAGLEDDLRRFEVLRRLLTRGLFHDPPGQSTGNPLPARVPASQRALDLDFNPVFTADQGNPLVEPEEIEPDELDARASLALTIISKARPNDVRDETAQANRTTRRAHVEPSDAIVIAASELEKILTLDPQHLTTRMARMMWSLELRHFQEARDDLYLVLNDPKLIAELRKNPRIFSFLHIAAQRFARYGLVAEALKIAEKAVDCSLELRQYQARSHYYFATVLSVAAQTDSSQINRAAAELLLAIRANERFKEWYRDEKGFDPVRTQINAALDQLPEITQKD